MYTHGGFMLMYGKPNKILSSKKRKEEELDMEQQLLLLLLLSRFSRVRLCATP